MGYAEDNPSSWRDVAGFLDEFPDDETWSTYKKDMRFIIESGIASHLDQFFRAGTSMHYILFSTLEHHGLRGEYFVTLARKPDRLFVVSYANRNVDFSAPAGQKTAPTPEEAFAVLRSFLLRLWRDTKRDEEVPIALLS